VLIPSGNYVLLRLLLQAGRRTSLAAISRRINYEVTNDEVSLFVAVRTKI
jgi:hypothetical protein